MSTESVLKKQHLQNRCQLKHTIVSLVKQDSEMTADIVPELIEDKQADNCSHVGMTRARLKTNGHITTARVDDALSQYCTQLSHHIFMLVTNHLRTHTTIINHPFTHTTIASSCLSLITYAHMTTFCYSLYGIVIYNIMNY